MTAPDAASVEEVIAGVLRQHAKTGETREGNPWKDRCYCGGWTYSMAGHQAAAVRDAVRAMTPLQQAEMLGGLAETATFARVVDDVPVTTRVRVVGPWRVEP